jgi:hypothetical protein
MADIFPSFPVHQSNSAARPGRKARRRPPRATEPAHRPWIDRDLIRIAKRADARHEAVAP